MVTKAAPLVARYLTPVLLAAVLVVLLPGEARACSCAPVTTAEVVESAEFVFVGQETSRAVARQDWPPVAVTFTVFQAYKGTVTSEMTVWTGQGDGDCGLQPTLGLVGITAYTDGLGIGSVDSCGSLHSPEAIAALLDPITITDSSPSSPVPADGGSALSWPVAALVAATVLVVSAVVLARRRSDDWQDGWSSGA
jgi:hypothetical protein